MSKASEEILGRDALDWSVTAQGADKVGEGGAPLARNVQNGRARRGRHSEGDRTRRPIDRGDIDPQRLISGKRETPDAQGGAQERRERACWRARVCSRVGREKPGSQNAKIAHGALKEGFRKQFRLSIGSENTSQRMHLGPLIEPLGGQ